MSDQMAVGEVEEYAHDGIEPTDEQFFDWFFRYKNGANVFTWIFESADDNEAITIGNCLSRLCMVRSEVKNAIYTSPSDIRDTAVCDLMRETLRPMLKKYYWAECKAFLDNGGAI